MEYRRHKRKQFDELRPWSPGEDMAGISVSPADRYAGSPKEGDMIARNPDNHSDRWLVNARYYREHFEPVED